MRDHDTTPGAAEKALLLLAACLAAMAMPLTFTGTAVALPAIGKALGGSPIALNWVTNAFMLTFGGGLMAAGAFADSFGRKRVFLIGTAAFALVSAALVVAPTIFLFDLLRAVQGAAAAASLAGGMATLAQEFEGPSLPRAFSVVGTSFGVGLAFGPILSGMMIDTFGWRSIFMLVIALTTGAFGLAAVFMRESRDPDATGLDWPGAISFTAALTLFTFGMLQAPEAGWSDPTVIVLLAGSAALMAAFVVVEQRVGRPMLDLSLFRYPRFVGVQLLAAAPAYAFVVLLILLPVRFVGVEGMDEVTAGQMMIGLSAPLLILPLAAGYLSRWIAPSTLSGAGLLVAAAGLLWLSTVPLGGAVLAPMLTIGMGIGLPWGLMDGLAVSVVPKERAGMATGIFNTTRVAGEGVALAVVTAMLSGLTASYLSTSAIDPATAAQRLVTGDVDGAASLLASAPQAVLADAYGAAFATLLLLLAAITTVTAIVVFLFLGRQAGRETEVPDEPAGEAEEAVCAMQP